MAKLKIAALNIAALNDDKPVKVTVEMPATVHRDLVAYAEILARQSGQPVGDPTKVIVPMLVRFMATDRAFGKARKLHQDGNR